MESTKAYSSSSYGTQATTEIFKPILSGVITGQIAGLIMAVVVMVVFTVFLDKNPLYPVQLIGSVIYGEPALHGFHLNALLAGLVLHQFGPSLFWGVVFGLLATKLPLNTKSAALTLGITVGIVSMFEVYTLVPFVMKALQGVDLWNREVPIFWDWAAHLVFGASFVLYPTIHEKLNGSTTSIEP